MTLTQTLETRNKVKHSHAWQKLSKKLEFSMHTVCQILC